MDDCLGRCCWCVNSIPTKLSCFVRFFLSILSIKKKCSSILQSCPSIMQAKDRNRMGRAPKLKFWSSMCTTIIAHHPMSHPTQLLACRCLCGAHHSLIIVNDILRGIVWYCSRSHLGDLPKRIRRKLESCMLGSIYAWMWGVDEKLVW